jgi:hypothetical protein
MKNHLLKQNRFKVRVAVFIPKTEIEPAAFQSLVLQNAHLNNDGLSSNIMLYPT